MRETSGDCLDVWFTPGRFALLLAMLIFAAFPQVLLGLETFVARDYGFFAYPLAHFQQQCFLHGELPFWDPYNCCGTPFLAQWNTMPLYPPALVYLLLPLQWSLGLFCLLHLWFAGCGMFFLARRWTDSPFAAAFAGVAFTFNGLTLNLLMWPSHIATLAWAPWVVLAVEPAWREGGKAIFLAALTGALQMLAGGPEIIFFTWTLLLALWIQQFITGGSDDASPIFSPTGLSRPSRGTILWRFPLIVLLVFLLAAAQLLPFLDLVAHSQRGAGYADTRWSMPGWGWVNFFVPMAFGTTRTEGIFFQPGQYWTSSYYLGLGTLWLAALALVSVRKSRVWLLGVAVAAAFACALGDHTPIYPALRKWIPLLSFVTYPVKFTLVIMFAAPLLAAFALANLPKIKRLLLPAGLMILLLLAGIVLWTQLAPLPGGEPHMALTNGLSRAVFLVLTGTTLFVLVYKTESRLFRVAPLLFIFFAWLDVFTHEPAQNPAVPPSVFQPGLARTELAMRPQPELGGSRAMISPASAMQLINFSLADPRNNFLAKRAGYCADVNLLDAVPKVDGFFSLTPREIDDVLSLLYGATNADFPSLEDFLGVSQITVGDQIFRWQSRNSFMPLVTAGQKPVFLDDAETLPALAQPGFDGNRTVYLPSSEKSLVVVTNSTNARILNPHFGPQQVDADVEAAGATFVVVSQTYYHAWSAFVDNVPVPLLRANHAFQAVQVPTGTHHVRLAYKDQAFKIGAAMAVPTWMACLIGLALMRKRPGTPGTQRLNPDSLI